MAKVKVWLKAFRLRTLPLSLSGIIFGSFVAYQQGFWDTTIFILALCTTLFFQILSNLANDLGDTQKGADNEGRVGPKRAVQSGEISSNQMKNGVIILAILSAISAGWLIYFGVQDMPNSVLWSYVVLAIACIIAAITYTMGKGAYGYKGLGDVMVFIFFGLVSVMGVFSLYSKMIDPLVVLPAIAFGLLSVAVLNLNNMRDHENDAQVGKKTLVVKMGLQSAKVYHSSLLILSFICLLIFMISSHIIGVIALLPYFVLFWHLKKVWHTQAAHQLDPELKKVALSTFAIAILFLISTLI
ncbi:MAG: 1,4-dihydroxy-2-naphthoate octaprenyltransferase [Crocinitomicaceae bacterium]|nr:1,4-dihydroxy-2-naphthoate octaprenyltransferase [Crocinitomicaceae bacterium]